MTIRPNILLITSDQQHHSMLGVTNPILQTPSLDRLCREGTRFNRAYCPNPTCSPTRASLITGMDPSQHGCWSLGCKLPEDVPTVGGDLAAAGYDTTLIGKAHLQPVRSDPSRGVSSIECHPYLRDLDFWRTFNDRHTPWYGFGHVETNRNHADEAWAGQHYAIWMEEKGLKNWRDFFMEIDPATGMQKRPPHYRQWKWELPEQYHYSVWTADRAIARIESNAAKQQPFFCWASFADPHPPYLVPEPWDTMYDPADMHPGTAMPGEHDHNPPHFAMTQQRAADFSAWQETGHANHGLHSHLTDETQAKKDMAVYYGMTSLMDREMGRILHRLDTLGIADNTLVIFTSDHGHFLGQHGLWHKGPFHYEDVVRVPFIVRWPGGGVPAGRVSDALQSLTDVPATALTAAGLAVPGRMQGINQLDVWRNKSELARSIVVVENRHQPTRLHVRTYITQRYKLTVYRNQTYGELFDLVADPGETKNLWNDSAATDVKSQLMQQAVQAEIAREPMRIPRISHA